MCNKINDVVVTFSDDRGRAHTSRKTLRPCNGIGVMKQTSGNELNTDSVKMAGDPLIHVFFYIRNPLIRNEPGFFAQN